MTISRSPVLGADPLNPISVGGSTRGGTALLGALLDTLQTICLEGGLFAEVIMIEVYWLCHQHGTKSIATPRKGAKLMFA